MPAPALSPAARRFVLHWGEMGTRWGINRTVAQIHALLYLSDRPLPAEEIAEALSVARSNVSTSLRELMAWRIVRVVHLLGDRRDHFESSKDVWDMFRVILEERKRREIDPTLDVLAACVAEAERGGASDAHAKERIGEMLSFLKTMDEAYRRLSSLSPKALQRLLKVGGMLGRLSRGRGR